MSQIFGKYIYRHGFVEKLSDNIPAKFQPNWSSGCRLGVENVRTTRQNFTFEKKKGKYIFCGVLPVMRL